MNITIFNCNCNLDSLLAIIKSNYDGTKKLLNIDSPKIIYVDQSKISINCNFIFENTTNELNDNDEYQYHVEEKSEFVTIDFVIYDAFIYIDITDIWSTTIFDFQFIDDYQKVI